MTVAAVAVVLVLYVKYVLAVLAVGVVAAGLVWLAAVLRPYIQRATEDD